nr:zinc finger protein 211-like [Dasypus novemcinctus]
MVTRTSARLGTAAPGPPLPASSPLTALSRTLLRPQVPMAAAAPMDPAPASAASSGPRHAYLNLRILKRLLKGTCSLHCNPGPWVMRRLRRREVSMKECGQDGLTSDPGFQRKNRRNMDAEAKEESRHDDTKLVLLLLIHNSVCTHQNVLQDSATFDDVVVHFSWEEWGLLDESQRCLYHDVMMENFVLITSLGLWCGGENKEAPSEQRVSVERVSQVRTIKSDPSTQKAHLCEMCVPVMKDIFLAKHQLIHPGQKWYTCGTCGKQFWLTANLHQHRKEHSGEKVFSKNMNRSSFAKNYIFHTSGEPLTCGVVGKDFPANVGLLQNQTNPTGVKPHNSTEHVEAFHNGKRHYKCDDCKKAFSHKRTLVQHQRVHTGEGLYECSECGKTFTYRHTFVQHKTVHTGERP